MMLAAIGIFVAGSVACALAPSMTALVLARGVQGLGGGGLMALAQTIIADIVSPRERGRYQGYIGAVFATSSVGGPVLGGFLTEHIDWSLIFWINLPLGLIALGMTSSVLRRVPFHARKHSLDVIGALLMMSASIALLVALSWGGRRYEWISPQIGVLPSFVRDPVGPLHLASCNHARAISPTDCSGKCGRSLRHLAGACNMGTLVGMTIFVPLYFEVVLHLSASQSGPRFDPADGGNSHIFHNYRTTHDAYGALQARLADRACAINPFARAIGHLARLDADLDRVVALAHHWRRTRPVFPVSTVCMQNAVSRSQMGLPRVRPVFSLAVFGAGRCAAGCNRAWTGGVAGMSIEMLARTASAPELAYAFRFVLLACGLVLSFGMAFLIAMEERPLKGPSAPHSGQRTDGSRNADPRREAAFCEDASHTVLPPARESSTTWLTISNPILSSRSAYSAASRLAW